MNNFYILIRFFLIIIFEMDQVLKRYFSKLVWVLYYYLFPLIRY